VFVLFFLPAIIFATYLIYRIITRNKQISAQAALVNTFLEIIRPKYYLKHVFANPPRTNSPLKPSKKFSNRYHTTYNSIDGTECITANLRNMETHIHIIYLHGGAYVLGKNGMKSNESFISRLIEGTGAKVTFVDYPVAPETRFQETLTRVYNVYQYLGKEYPDDVFMLVGDSAGGGLALSLAQMIREKPSVKPPRKLVLFSPWLDLSMGNPDIDLQEKKDMILSKRVLLYAAEQYADPSEFKNPLVSPIYGDLKGLGEVLVFFGSLELFYADGLRMQRMTQDRPEFNYRFYMEMPHDWVLFPIPEASLALQEAYNFILDQLNE